MAMGYKLSARVLLEGLQRGNQVHFTVDTEKADHQRDSKNKN